MPRAASSLAYPSIMMCFKRRSIKSTHTRTHTGTDTGITAAAMHHHPVLAANDAAEGEPTALAQQAAARPLQVSCG